MKLLSFLTCFIYIFNLQAKIHLKFTINKDLLVLHSLYKASSQKFSFHSILESYPNEISILKKYQRENNHYKVWSIENDTNLEIRKSLDTIQASHEFQTFYNETFQFLKEVEKEWLENETLSHNYIQEITKLNFEKEFTVYITHPQTGRAGSYLEKNRIHWGVKDDRKNYSTVYLWHEILHSYIERSNRGHVSIELATDYELAKRLDPWLLYGFEGHKELRTKKTQLLEEGFWKKFLDSKNLDLIDFSLSFDEFE